MADAVTWLILPERYQEYSIDALRNKDLPEFVAAHSFLKAEGDIY
jgi:hypothetical protein